jgi:MraZ protein
MATVDYFQRKLDDKRRLTIPAELRAEFASGVVVTQGFQKYLHLYPKSVWDELVEPELQGSILDEQIADLNVRFRMGKT